MLVVPRLTTVDIAEAGLGDWPTTLAEEVSFLDADQDIAGRTDRRWTASIVAQARSEVWTGFFGGDAGLVNEYQPKTNPVPNVSPTHADATRAAQTYRTVTRAAADPDTDADAAIRPL